MFHAFKSFDEQMNENSIEKHVLTRIKENV